MELSQADSQFYDTVATKIDDLSKGRGLTITDLAKRIGWGRTNLTKFINRTGKPGLDSHLLVKIARELRVSVADLTAERAAGVKAGAGTDEWDGRVHRPGRLFEKLAELPLHQGPAAMFSRLLPATYFPNDVAVLKFLNSLFSNGDGTLHLTRWREVIEHQRQKRANPKAPPVEVIRFMLRHDLDRLIERQHPFELFSVEDVMLLLMHLRDECVKHQHFRLAVIEDEAWEKDPALEFDLAATECLAVLADSVRIERAQDMRVRWSDNAEQIDHARLTMERIRSLSGLGIAEEVTKDQTFRLLDGCLRKAERFRIRHPLSP